MEIVPSPSGQGVENASDESLFSDWLSSDGGDGLQSRDVRHAAAASDLEPAEFVAVPSVPRQGENGTVVPAHANVPPPSDHDRFSHWTATATAAESAVAGSRAGRAMSTGDCEQNSDYPDVESYHYVSSNSDNGDDENDNDRNDDVDDCGASGLRCLTIDGVADGCGVPAGPAAAVDRSPGVVSRSHTDNRTGDFDSKPSVKIPGWQDGGARVAAMRPNAAGTAAAVAAPLKDEPFRHLWTASSNLLSVKPLSTFDKKQKEKRIHDAYVCKKSKPPAAKSSNLAASRGARSPPGHKSSSYLKRQAERVEIARINDIMAKRLLNVKPAVSSFRG
ncbi:Hypothetical protein CINCED_3A016385 [Cinara cedri]|uniref:Uncharacterized protein n=1 Tax=Cinara cedri TaxID=506608 RepID=A0A5E4NDX6_9HEMI|nr:Hypothetical protein CINCED_3A016385 [Cinara cedri]